ncbi:MAG TPA: STAS domain-containing protein [Terriglobales bacterium]|nr:STAS domain-containing protein [Terriglobales bacterium]
MATVAVLLKVDGERVMDVLREAHEKLDAAGGELVLDFSCVRRIDSGALQALQQLAALVESKSAKLVLRSVNVDVYKVFKLVKLAPRFSYTC